MLFSHIFSHSNSKLNLLLGETTYTNLINMESHLSKRGTQTKCVFYTGFLWKTKTKVSKSKATLTC